MVTRLLLAAFLIGHGAIHGGFISPRPPATAGGPAWPFELGRSWVLTPAGLESSQAHLVGASLVAVVTGAFLLAAIASLGLLPGGAWVASIAIGSIASLALLVLFFHPWLLLGVVIDLALLWLALYQNWSPSEL